MSILKARGITKRFDYPTRVEVLKQIDLDIEPGDTVAIMGASGEGKSTLLHILGTLESASSGLLCIAGREVSLGDEAALRNRHIGFIFQSFFLMEDYTAFDNVLMPARIGRRRSGPGSASVARACDLLELVGLTERRSFPARLLSGGEKQRVAIARALMNDPDLVLADEPSGNLDHGNSATVHALLLDLVRRANKALVTVTHDPELAALCQRRFVLSDGCLEETK